MRRGRREAVRRRAPAPPTKRAREDDRASRLRAAHHTATVPDEQFLIFPCRRVVVVGRDAEHVATTGGGHGGSLRRRSRAPAWPGSTRCNAASTSFDLSDCCVSAYAAARL